jgi:hypothetical protein
MYRTIELDNQISFGTMEVSNEEGPLIDSDRGVEEGFLPSEFVAVESSIAQ